MIASINSGSSSIKFAFFEARDRLLCLSYGEIDRLGSPNATLSFFNAGTREKIAIPAQTANDDDAAAFLIDFLSAYIDFNEVTGMGHRIVHGMQHSEPERVTPDLLKYLKEISVFDPEHLPMALKLIEIVAKRYPKLTQFVCFDTAFHAHMPSVAKLLPIPRRYYLSGIHRYGFHGLSYAYLMEELKSAAGEDIAQGKIILAHLGSGASLAAVKNRESMDTSMGFTPSSGVMMGTRTGDLDPGVAAYLMQIKKLTPDAFSHLVNQESGLLGVSETSNDMRTLMEARETNAYAAEAIDLFCYQVKKWIGSFAAVLDGLDTLVFSGGIGEHSTDVRKIICSNMSFLGIALDDIKNRNNEVIISSIASRVEVRVMKTNEELMIARLVYRLIKNG